MRAMDTLAILQMLRETSGQLAARAREGDWDALPALQAAADVLVDELKAQGGVAAPGSPVSPEAAALIGAVLEDFSTAREFVAPWLVQVKPLLDAFSATRT